MYDSTDQRQWIGGRASPEALLARAIRLAKVAKAEAAAPAVKPCEPTPAPLPPPAVAAPTTKATEPRDVWFWIVGDGPRKLRIEDIQRAVADMYGVRLIDLRSARRTANVVRPRQLAMYLAKTLTLHSLPEIGRRFGGRDHTTVLHAVRKISALCEVDDDLCSQVESLKEELRSNFVSEV